MSSPFAAKKRQAPTHKYPTMFNTMTLVVQADYVLVWRDLSSSLSPSLALLAPPSLKGRKEMRD